MAEGVAVSVRREGDRAQLHGAGVVNPRAQRSALGPAACSSAAGEVPERSGRYRRYAARPIGRSARACSTTARASRRQRGCDIGCDIGCHIGVGHRGVGHRGVDHRGVGHRGALGVWWRGGFGGRMLAQMLGQMLARLACNIITAGRCDAAAPARCGEERGRDGGRQRHLELVPSVP